MLSIICKNCSYHYKGNYCPNCGQSAKVEPIGVKYFLHDIPHSILHIDKGFFYTLSKLLTIPGKTLAEYLDGKRVKHFRPFAFVVIMSTITTILIKLCNYFINKKFSELNNGEILNFENHFFSDYPAVLVFILIPLLSLVTWLCFKRRKYNYWEHFLINTYVAAYLNIFFLLIKFVQLIKYQFFNSYTVNYTIFMFFFMAYYGHVFGSLMHKKGSFWKIFFIMLVMNFFLASIYMTVFSLTGIMTPWWG